MYKYKNPDRYVDGVHFCIEENSHRNEFEGKYKILKEMKEDCYMTVGTCDSMKEMEEFLKNRYGNTVSKVA